MKVLLSKLRALFGLSPVALRSSARRWYGLQPQRTRDHRPAMEGRVCKRHWRDLHRPVRIAAQHSGQTEL